LDHCGKMLRLNDGYVTQSNILISLDFSLLPSSIAFACTAARTRAANNNERN
jgi:hypothetical protein